MAPHMMSRYGLPPNGPLWVLSGYALALFAATHWPQLSLPHVFNLQDRALHLACYTLLSLLAYWAFTTKGWATLSIRSILAVTLFASAFGAIDELTQYFAPGRVVDGVDWIADTAGGFLGAAMYGPLARLGLAQKFGVGGR